MSFTVIIPARFASTRLPGKPLADIAGKAMIQRVVEQARLSDAKRVVVATDELKLSIDALILELNDATLADKLVDILELNVEYPVVPVISTWILPDITDSVLILFLIVVSIELVKVFKLLVLVAIDVSLLF